jgi:maltooligosyltrehalose trehalohydrolase
MTVPVAALFRRNTNLAAGEPIFGAIIADDGVVFRVWAPEAERAELLVRRAGRVDSFAPERDGDGIWTAHAAAARAGDRYAYVLDGREPRPDPASRAQPDGVHGWSEIVDPRAFAWTDEAWTGLDPRAVVLYELHVGTFTPEGTFAAAAARLEDLRDLGVTAMELMPVADFPGSRNWGYDGVCLFAPARAYGRPDDLRAFVDRAHRLGLGVVLDVVYNHFGPEGAYLYEFAPAFFTERHQTPWGVAVNLDGPGSGVVRGFLIDNARHWLREYHVDGLRLDATHALVDDGPHPFVAELVDACHRHTRMGISHSHKCTQMNTDRRPLVYAEDHRNLAYMVEDAALGGWDLDGVWADDFHHILRRLIAGDAHGYFGDYSGSTEELATALRDGWLYSGQPSRMRGGPRGTDPSRVALRRSVICLQNHDQVGNRALGDRLHHGVDPAVWRAAVALLLTAPMTPLLFMGQEWSATSPFLFFTDFEPALGAAVAEGRRREFREFPQFGTPEAAARIPDPQARQTFEASRLRWEERTQPEHAGILALHRDLLRLRRAFLALHGSDDVRGEAIAPDEGAVAFRRRGPDADLIVAVRLAGGGPIDLARLTNGEGRWTPIATTEDPRFCHDPRPPRIDRPAPAVEFARPGAVVLART